MLGDNQAYATIAVRDGERARAFYEGKLGLNRVEASPGVATYDSGGSKVVIYESQYAGTNQATCVTWAVTNIDGVVAELRQKGIAFEHYPDMPGIRLEGDIHVSGERDRMRVAWLKDPDGNILSLYGLS